MQRHENNNNNNSAQAPAQATYPPSTDTLLMRLIRTGQSEDLILECIKSYSQVIQPVASPTLAPVTLSVTNPNDINENKGGIETALYLAFKHNCSSRVISSILAKGGDIYLAARIAAHQYDLATLKTLFAISLNGNNKPFNVITNEGLVMLDCLLLEAAGSSVDTPAEARETIQFLLGQGANVLAKSPTDGKSALMLASQNYNKPVVDILVAHNMTPDHINAVDLIGKTALFYVCIARNHDDTRDAIASVLLNCNADLTITYRGRRPGDYIHAPRSVLYATANLDNNIQAGQQLMGFPAAGQQLVYFPQSLQVPQPYRLAEEERKLAQMIMNVGFHQEQHKKAVKNVSELLHNVALINEDIKNICNLIATQYYLIDGQQNIVNALKNTSNNNNSNLPNTYPLNPVVGNVGVLPQWTAAMQNQVQAGAQALTQLQGLQNLKRPAENNNYLNNNNGNSNSNSNDKQGDPVAQITKKTK